MIIYSELSYLSIASCNISSVQLFSKAHHAFSTFIWNPQTDCQGMHTQLYLSTISPPTHHSHLPPSSLISNNIIPTRSKNRSSQIQSSASTTTRHKYGRHRIQSEKWITSQSSITESSPAMRTETFIPTHSHGWMDAFAEHEADVLVELRWWHAILICLLDGLVNWAVVMVLGCLATRMLDIFCWESRSNLNSTSK